MTDTLSLPAREPASNAAAALPIDRLWSLDECARFLRMSPSWVRRSDVPVVELGRARRYDPEQVRAYAVAHRSHQIDEPNRRSA